MTITKMSKQVSSPESKKKLLHFYIALFSFFKLELVNRDIFSRSIYIRKNGGKYMSLSKDENEEIGIPYCLCDDNVAR